ncbi:hypothetical protein DPMN_193988, partial [Dreissena polymorpha]
MSTKNAPPTGGHVFLSNWNQFQTCPNIIGTNLLTKCHDDRTINMASRVLTGGHVFPPTRTIFELIQDIIRTNHLTKFHNNRKINVPYRVFTMKNAPPPDIIRTNLLTKVLTKFYYSHIGKMPHPPGGHVFQPTSISFLNLSTIFLFHEDRKINVASRVKNAPPFGSHVFQANTKLRTKFHEEWTINVASRVKTPPPLGGHVFSLIWTIFKLANILTSKVFTRKTAPPLAAILHEDWTSTVFELNQTINVASRCSQGKMLTTYNAQRTKRQSQKLTMSMLHS